MSRLSRDGLVATQPYGPMTLTEVGRKMAQESKKRHDLVYQFLLAIGVPESAAADDAGGLSIMSVRPRSSAFGSFWSGRKNTATF